MKAFMWPKAMWVQRSPRGWRTLTQPGCPSLSLPDLGSFSFAAARGFFYVPSRKRGQLDSGFLCFNGASRPSQSQTVLADGLEGVGRRCGFFSTTYVTDPTVVGPTKGVCLVYGGLLLNSSVPLGSGPSPSQHKAHKGVPANPLFSFIRGLRLAHRPL